MTQIEEEDSNEIKINPFLSLLLSFFSLNLKIKHLNINYQFLLTFINVFLMSMLNKRSKKNL